MAHTNIKLQSILTCLFICLPRPLLTLVICVCAENKQHFRRMLLQQLKMLVLSTPSSPSSVLKHFTAALFTSLLKLKQLIKRQTGQNLMKLAESNYWMNIIN